MKEIFFNGYHRFVRQHWKFLLMKNELMKVKKKLMDVTYLSGGTTQTIYIPSPMQNLYMLKFLIFCLNYFFLLKRREKRIKTCDC